MRDDDPDRRRPALGRPWTRTVQRVIQRQGDRCWLCGDPGATVGDHVIPRVYGGQDTEENCRMAHAMCNSIRGERSPEWARAEILRRRHAARVAAAPVRRPSTSRRW